MGSDRMGGLEKNMAADDFISGATTPNIANKSHNKSKTITFIFVLRHIIIHRRSDALRLEL